MDMRARRSSAAPASTYIVVESDGSDSWRAEAALDALRNGGVGVLPTDTSYAFVAPLSSKRGVERILALKGIEAGKKPLSLLCADLSTVDRYAAGIDKALFKLFRGCLPGPYTFILPARNSVPKTVHADGKRTKRRELGIRVPDDPVLAQMLAQLDEPLLCSTVPTSEEGSQLVCHSPADEDGASWCRLVDFIVDAGERPVDSSTIYDLTEGELVLVREGAGTLLG
eukprot:CAMPEP_0183332524 /NCGR_PEP_ID=MMETSP0164_2-20130417/1666_1 /TAXON_ID=221442 /ORGANISM="Coccolithus pelagicus ssp braarudi, Strain PLY182g" /LENGTH=225 /DNA_ID=CAMNT_0025501263 /DNA_START=127 /DNA_END=804 /DNA_ORIENTATION=+